MVNPANGFFIVLGIKLLRVNRSRGGFVEAIAEVTYKCCAPAEPESHCVFASVEARTHDDPRPLRQRLIAAVIDAVREREADRFEAAEFLTGRSPSD